VPPRYSKTILFLWIAGTLALPVLLVAGAWRTYRALDGQREIFLRSRMAAIASTLETAPAALDDEPGILALEILTPPPDPAADPLGPLWQGHELFRTEMLSSGGQRLFRAIVPFHSAEGLRLARIDIDVAEADFLTRHARNHLILVCLGSAAFVVLSLLTFRSLRRQFELEHLAQLGTMSAVLAHEIRNPLGTIKGFAQLLIEKAAPSQKPLLDPILSETLRLESLVHDLLLYGRPAQPEIRTVSASDLAARLALHTPGAPAFQTAVPAVTFSSDPNLLEQALLNLVRNALEAVENQSGPEVRLSMENTRREVIWRVDDNGPGLSADAQARLFEPFRTTKAFGTGLGLSITKKLVVALGGSLSVSNRPGGGARAEIRLPQR
jgi:two-component system sensor histidine kinase HydH